MLTLPWERPSRVAEVGHQIWSYVSPASQREGPGLLTAAALLGWPASDDVSKLAQIQFLLTDEVKEFVQQLPTLARRFSTTSVRNGECSTERIRGPVHWGQTLTSRAARGSTNLYVTAPMERAYQTEENELLIHVLDAVVHFASASGWDKQRTSHEPAMTIRTHLVEATRWQKHQTLTSIERVQPTQRSLSRIAAGRSAPRYDCVLRAYHQLDALVQRLDRNAIRRAIEQTGLVTAAEHILFELLTLFRVIDALNIHGWSVRPLYLFQGQVHTHGTKDDGRRLDLWYQSTPPVLGTASIYRNVLAAHKFTHLNDLRPDMVLHWTDSTNKSRVLLVECKLTTKAKVQEAARSALTDLLAYRQAFAAPLADAKSPYGLGVAWGSGLIPQHDQSVMLCTPEMIGEALRTTAE